MYVVDRKSKNNVVGISVLSRCPSLSRCLVLPHPCGCKKNKDMSILRLARSILVCKWHQWHKVGEKDQSFLSAGNSTLNTFLAVCFVFTIGPLHLAIHLVQDQNICEQKLYWDKTNKGNYH